MPILIKCNASDVTSAETISFDILAEPNIALTNGDDVLIWTSEQPRQGPFGKGLQASGRLLSWELSYPKALLRVEVSAQFEGPPLGMEGLKRIGQRNSAAWTLYDRIHKFRPRRVWELSAEEFAFLADLFKTEDRNILIDVQRIEEDQTLAQTTRKALIDARLGQGKFRSLLQLRWGDACAVTGCTLRAVLRASHIKPWSTSTNEERLDPENGLLLAAHLDALFDSGLISFRLDGKMLLSADLAASDAELLRLPAPLRLDLTAAEQLFLDYHRRSIFSGPSK